MDLGTSTVTLGKYPTQLVEVKYTGIFESNFLVKKIHCTVGNSIFHRGNGQHKLFQLVEKFRYNVTYSNIYH